MKTSPDATQEPDLIQFSLRSSAFAVEKEGESSSRKHKKQFQSSIAALTKSSHCSDEDYNKTRHGLKDDNCFLIWRLD